MLFRTETKSKIIIKTLNTVKIVLPKQTTTVAHTLALLYMYVSLQLTYTAAECSAGEP